MGDARRIVEKDGATHVKVGIFDVDGIMRGKYMSKDKFLSSLEGGFGFCDVVIGWDSNDQLYDNTKVTGWHTAYPDAPVRILPETCRRVPFEDGMLMFLGEFEGHAEPVCPRGLLGKMVKKARDMGFEPFSACEYEFFVFDETPHSVRDKNYQNLKPITPGNFGYSMLRNTVWAEFYHELIDLSEAMRFPIEGLHTETGPGVLEAAIAVTDTMESADRAALFKTFTKVLAQRHELMATFMAKWSPDYPGQSGHVHVSLQNSDGTSAFYDADQPHQMSTTMRHFLGGLQMLMPELLGMVSNTVNSYSRLVPGAWAPTTAAWSVDNRTTALRVIPGSPKSQRVEYRIAAADMNPYLSLAAILGSGLYGIENEIEPAPIVVGNAYAQTHPPELQLPQTLWEAAQRLKASTAARELFGDTFVEHYAASREWEEREFRKAITDWELKRYFEII
ncbi:MAG: glutamine synthetase [Myxococcales bacterium]|nr:glutamine synthetase [Myxococcales bacterium]